MCLEAHMDQSLVATWPVINTLRLNNCTSGPEDDASCENVVSIKDYQVKTVCKGCGQYAMSSTQITPRCIWRQKLRSECDKQVTDYQELII